MTKQVQLIMVTENNNNKFYNMYEESDHIKIEYGRVGAAVRTCTKPLSKWDSVYREKIRKGYKDITNLKQEVKVSGYKEIEDQKIKYIVDLLISRARQTIANNYKVSYQQVTQAQINEAQDIIDSLVKDVNNNLGVKEFNKLLLKLYTAIPRKMAHVQDYLLNEQYVQPERKLRLISNEQDLLDTMATQVKQNRILEEGSQDRTILEATGLNLYVASNTDLEIIKSKMGANYNQLRRAWRIDNLRTLKDYQESYESVSSTSRKNDLFWHGSRTENWWSIISNGLIIRPSNAIHTGSMFGDGLYFANKAQKSIGYTSLANSYWSHGRDNKAYLALYTVRIGKQYHINKHTSECYTLNYNKIKDKGFDSVFAHAGKDLRNDEFIIYNPAQCTIKYLIEISE